VVILSRPNPDAKTEGGRHDHTDIISNHNSAHYFHSPQAVPASGREGVLIWEQPIICIRAPSASSQDTISFFAAQIKINGREQFYFVSQNTKYHNLAEQLIFVVFR
jgi:hypothetical protein